MKKTFPSLKALKNLSCIFFIALAVINLIADIFSNKFTIADVIFIIVATMPMLLDKKWFYKIYGLTGALIFGYLFIAVFVSNVSGIQQSNMDPVINYIIGYSFGIIGFLASAMLVYVGFYKDEITGELKMSEVQAN